MPNRLALPLTKAANVLHKESVQKRQGERERERTRARKRERVRLRACASERLSEPESSSERDDLEQSKVAANWPFKSS